MKTVSLIIVMALSVTFINAQEDQKGQTITITINNIKSNAGKVLLSLHTENTFMKARGIQNTQSKIIDGKVIITFDNVIPGAYAIMALHDANENNKMDFEANGMPKESYGMSNNPMSFGPPEYATAKFELENEDLEMNITF